MLLSLELIKNLSIMPEFPWKATDPEGRTILHLAIGNKNPEVVQYLYEMFPTLSLLNTRPKLHI